MISTDNIQDRDELGNLLTYTELVYCILEVLIYIYKSDREIFDRQSHHIYQSLLTKMYQYIQNHIQINAH